MPSQEREQYQVSNLSGTNQEETKYSVKPKACA